MTYGLYANGSGANQSADRRGLHQRLPRRGRDGAAAAEHVDAPGGDLQRQCPRALRERRPGEPAPDRRLAHGHDQPAAASAATPIWGEWFQGDIDEVRIYNRALAAAEITGRYGDLDLEPRRVRAVGAGDAVGVGWLELGARCRGVRRPTTSVWCATTCTAARARASRRRWRTGSGSRPGRVTRDAGLAAGVYYYRVTAEDAAGNVGPVLERGVGDGRGHAGALGAGDAGGGRIDREGDSLLGGGDRQRRCRALQRPPRQ